MLFMYCIAYNLLFSVCMVGYSIQYKYQIYMYKI
jgi:hypothetical protein